MQAKNGISIEDEEKRGLIATAIQEGTTARTLSDDVVLTDSNGHSRPQLISTKIDVLPTSSRIIQGLRDMAALVLITLPFLFFRMARNILAWMGITEHQLKGASLAVPLSAEEKEQLADVITILRTNRVPEQRLEQAIVAVGSGADTRPGTRMLAHLGAVTSSLESTASQFSLLYDEVYRQPVLRKLAMVLEEYASEDKVDPQDVLKSLRRAAKHAVTKLVKMARGGKMISKQEVVSFFAFKILMETSRALPPTLSLVIDIDRLFGLGSGQMLIETCSIVPLDVSMEFLRAYGDKYGDQMKFMTDYPYLRPSDAKKQHDVQAMTVNARYHALLLKGSDGSVTEVAGSLRSGAFCTHGRVPKKMGLASLVNLYNHCTSLTSLSHQSSILSSVSMSSLPQLEREIETRKVFCISQALPLVHRAIKDLCTKKKSMTNAFKSGSFLYCQQSLLSDLSDGESAMLQDLRGALDEISSHLIIKFVFRPGRTIELVNNSKYIILYLDRDSISDSALPEGVSRDLFLSRDYRVTTVVFSCGINVLQSLGFFSLGALGLTLQDLYNREALERMIEYASSCEAKEALAPLLAHYAPVSQGGSRQPKDVESIWLVRDVVKELGGARAVNCKSGKDRTAMELALSFAMEAGRELKLSEEKQEKLCRALQRGLSYQITAQNNGKPTAYAFNEFELATMPPKWAPEWKLCGKVET